jgi:hypothetical protein
MAVWPLRMVDRDRQRFQLHELDNRSGLAYWCWNWGLLAREQGDHGIERQKLDAALDIFTQLNMPRERDEVRAELEKATAPD